MAGLKLDIDLGIKKEKLSKVNIRTPETKKNALEKLSQLTKDSFGKPTKSVNDLVNDAIDYLLKVNKDFIPEYFSKEEASLKPTIDNKELKTNEEEVIDSK